MVRGLHRTEGRASVQGRASPGRHTRFLDVQETGEDFKDGRNEKVTLDPKP